ncbi:MAG: hypothetical protein RL065_1088, partial [Bacteroidota bacterium]
NTILKGTVLNNLGNLFNQLGDIEKALIFYTDAYQIYSKTSELNKLNVIIMNIGVIYLRTKNHQTGIAYLKRSKSFFEETHDLLNLCNAANIIGVGLFTIGIYDEAKIYFVESLDNSIKIDDKTNSCRANLYLGLIALKELKLDDANMHFHNSMKIAIESDMKVARVFNYKGFAEMFTLRKDFNNALEQLSYAFKICEELNLKEEKIEIYFLYSDIYKQMGEFEKAYQSLFAYRELKEKFLEEENTYKIQKLQITNQISQITREKELAEQASAAKSNFLSNMSHEIRTPMNAVFGFADLLSYSDTLSGTDLTYVNTIKQASENMLHIINEILDLSKIEAGKIVFNKDEFDLENEMKKTFQMFTLQAKAKNLIFSLSVSKEINTKLIGDSFRLNQVLVNLIGNALKFTERGSIKILVKPLEVFNHKMMVQFQIQDTGIGIDSSKLEQIFERYKQVSAKTAVHYGGTGLGLSISKQLIELQDGSMAVTPNQGGGSIFSFCIPYNILLSKTDAEPVNKVFNEQEVFNDTFRVLIVDDSPLNQLLLKEVISKVYLNATAECVDNGIAAISMANRFEYDVIILDMKMPDMDGTEVCKRIRQINDYYAKVPIVGHTAGVTDEDRKKVDLAGMNYFLPKPFKREQLFQMFRDLGIVKS